MPFPNDRITPDTHAVKIFCRRCVDTEAQLPTDGLCGDLMLTESPLCLYAWDDVSKSWKKLVCAGSESTDPVPSGIDSLMISGITASGATFTWVLLAGGGTPEEYIFFYRKVGEPSFIEFPIGLPHPDSSEFIGDAILDVPGDEYQLYVVARNAAGDGPVSNIVTFFLLCDVVQNVAVSPTGLVSWDDVLSGDPPATYAIFVDNVEVGTVAHPTQSYQLTSLDFSTAYSIKVKARNPAGDSADSNVVAFTTPPAPPQEPTGLSSINVTDTSADLSWTAPASGNTPDTYDIYIVSPSLVLDGTVSHPTVTFALTGLDPNTEYDVRVVAVNAGGNSDGSNIVTFTTDPAAVVVDMISILSGTQSKTAGEIKTIMRNRFRKGVIQTYAPSFGGLGLAALADGAWSELPFSALRIRRIGNSWIPEQSEWNHLHIDVANAANSFFSLQNKSLKQVMVRLTDGENLGQIDFANADQAYAGRPDPTNPRRVIIPNSGRFSYINLDGADGDYPTFASASFPGFIIGSGDEGSSGWDSFKGDGNDFVLANLDGTDRILFALSSNGETENIFVADVINGLAMENFVDGSPGALFMNFRTVAADARAPLLWTPGFTFDYGFLARNGDHYIVLNETAGETQAYEFDGTLIGKILDTTPHIDSFLWTERNGSQYPAVVTKGTPGVPLTGQGDTIIQTYEITTNPTTGARSVSLRKALSGVDIDPAFSQGGLAQVSAHQFENQFILVSMKPTTDLVDGGADYYGEDALFLIVIDERIIPPVWGDTLAIYLGPHGIDTETFQRQIEHQLGQLIPANDPSGFGGYINNIFRSDDGGENTSNYFLFLEVGPIPDHQKLFAEISSVELDATATSVAAGGSITLSIGAQEGEVGTITTVDFWVDGAVVNTDASAPFSYAHTFASAGTVDCQAVATDNNGDTWETTIQRITVTA